jgi:hypothetical protein
MNYKKIYSDLIDRRKKNPLSVNEYGENHHIVPKSLGGLDDNNNLVRLSAREHFISHLLLSEMYEKESHKWYKMNHAFQMMCSNSNSHLRYINSRIYELKKLDFKKTMSWSQSGEKNSQFGVKKSDEIKLKIKESISKRLGIIDGLNAKERKKIERQKEKIKYNFQKIFFNKQRRNKIFQVFKIDISEDFDVKIKEVKNFLEKLYITEKKSAVDISKVLNCDDETIRNYLKLFEIPMRSLSESIKNSYNINK